VGRRRGPLAALALIALAGAGAGLYARLQAPEAALETVDLKVDPAAGTPLCPWRDPERDARAFFGGPGEVTTETVILTPYRDQILRRLGPGTPLRENAVQVHRVRRDGREVGAVLTRRTRGRYGAIEVVVGIGSDGRVAGVHVQRHRERPEAARVLASPEWTGAFRGKNAGDAFRPGRDLPAVPEGARESALAVADAARALVIEHAVAEAHRAGARRRHH
jgi:hypothetical protein